MTAFHYLDWKIEHLRRLCKTDLFQHGFLTITSSNYVIRVTSFIKTSLPLPFMCSTRAFKQLSLTLFELPIEVRNIVSIRTMSFFELFLSSLTQHGIICLCRSRYLHFSLFHWHQTLFPFEDAASFVFICFRQCMHVSLNCLFPFGQYEISVLTTLFSG